MFPSAYLHELTSWSILLLKKIGVCVCARCECKEHECKIWVCRVGKISCAILLLSFFFFFFDWQPLLDRELLLVTLSGFLGGSWKGLWEFPFCLQGDFLKTDSFRTGVLWSWVVAAIYYPSWTVMDLLPVAPRDTGPLCHSCITLPFAYWIMEP